MKIEDEIKSKFRNDYQKGVVNLTFTANLLEYHFLQFLKDFNITSQQFNILRILRGFKGPASITILKDRMLDKNSDVSRIVDKLFEKELIYRKECPNDRRQKEIEISEIGLELLAKIDVEEQKADSLLKNLTLEEVQELNRLLDKIRD